MIRLVNEPLVSVRWSGESFFYGKWSQYAAGLTYLVDKHPELREEPAAASRIGSQVGFALAAAGRRRGVAHVVAAGPADRSRSTCAPGWVC